MKKKSSIIVVLLTVICVSSLTSAIILEVPLDYGDGGVFDYQSVFFNQRGVLSVTTVGFFNGSGVSIAEMIISANSFDNISFRLKIFDSEIESYVDPNNELGLYSKTRKAIVSPNVDTKGEIYCILSVTNEPGDITYASIYLEYYYSEESYYIPPWAEDDYISLEDHRKALNKLYWAIAQIILGAIGGGLLIWLIARKKYQRSDEQ